ncbi:MAG: YggT family protein [Candidatus Dormibacteraeota bacterium]|nr:YggT family protein [Candidatus Dormibacteraeota bacterium]
MHFLVSLLDAVGYALVIAIFVRVAFSWFSQDSSSPIYRFVFQVTEPLLGPVRRLLPSTGALDLSPAVVSFGLLIVMGMLNRL